MTEPIFEQEQNNLPVVARAVSFSDRPFYFELFYLWAVTIAFFLVFFAAEKLGLASSDPNRVRLIFSTFVIINITGAFISFQGLRLVPTRGRAYEICLFLSLALLSAAIANFFDLMLWATGFCPLKTSILPNICFVLAMVFGMLGIFKLAQLCLITPGIATALIFSILVALILLVSYQMNSTPLLRIDALENGKEFLFGLVYAFVIGFIGSVCAQIMIFARGFFRLPSLLICTGTIGLSFGCSIYGAQFLTQDTMTVSSSPVHVILGLSYVLIGLGVYRLGNIVLEKFHPDLDQLPKLDLLVDVIGPSMGLKVFEELTTQLMASQSAHRQAEAEASVNSETIKVLKNEIARRQKAEDDLRSARDKAEAGNIAKSNFLAMISHELRTPLTAIVAYGKLLSDEQGPFGERISPEAREFGSRILKSGEHLQNLIDSVLSYSNLEAGNTLLKTTRFDLATLIELLEWFVNLQETKNRQVRFELVKPAKPVLLFSDPLAIRQVLINLLSNAFKFTRVGKIILSFSEEEGNLRVAVSDTGIGIPADQIENLFLPFFQVSTGSRRRFGGTGLGLAIVKNLVDALKGTISFESKEGYGTTFTILLPGVVRIP